MNFIEDIKQTIFNTKNLKNRYIVNHPNQKYSIDLIINEIIYVLKSGVSWNLARTKVNSKTLYWHYSDMVRHNIFGRAFNRVRNKYVKLFGNNDTSVLIDTSIVYNRCGVNKIGRNKYYRNKNSTKISLATDINGVPLSIFFMKGNYHDISIFNKHINHVIQSKRLSKNITVIADKG